MNDETRHLIGKRLKELRKEQKLTQAELSEQLQEHVALVLNEEKGKQTLSQIERGTRGLTLEMAIAYSKVFDVSLDYLYCQSDNRKEENKKVKEILPLSDLSIKHLQDFINEHQTFKSAHYAMLNYLFERKVLFTILDQILNAIIITKLCNDEYLYKTTLAQNKTKSLESYLWQDSSKYQLWECSQNIYKTIVNLYEVVTENDDGNVVQPIFEIVNQMRTVLMKEIKE